MNKIDLTKGIKQRAHDLGFDLCRIISIENTAHAEFYEAWLNIGSAADMGYLERNVEKRRDPRLLADHETKEFLSLIVLAVNYHQFALPHEIIQDKSRGIIASYAWGNDYHEIIRPVLHELDSYIRSRTGRLSQGKCLIDTGPVLERDWAHRAGIGFTGKNCCTINPKLGSWLFLATIMIPEELCYDELQSIDTLKSEDVVRGLPASANFGTWQIPAPTNNRDMSDKIQKQTYMGTCGKCTRCLVACPTDAFVGPFHLDPRKCISYWTIETRDPIPINLRSNFFNRIFGCDICQEVCPWNKKLKPRSPLYEGLLAQTDRVAPHLLDGFNEANPYWLNQQSFSLHFRKSPIKRAKRSGMLRNVCVALGNWGEPETVNALILALNDSEFIARGHAAWALGRVLRKHQNDDALIALSDRHVKENVDWVREEIQLALRS